MKSSYIAKKIITASTMLWGITVVSFLVARIIPDSVIVKLVSENHVQGIVGYSVDEIKTIIIHAYGLDQPIQIHYLRWMGLMIQEDSQYHGVFQGDLGYSIWEPQPY
jgi:ABC-type dipeptide/oligopeptide/nickel transport system permease component